LDKAKTGHDVAQSRHTQAAERLRLLETGSRVEKIEA